MRSSRRHVLIGASAPIASLSTEIAIAASSDAKVLITGETGVGKEVVAHEIHQRSRRAGGPFVTINCAGVPDTLLESEFFGHTRGSFTGAFRDNPGLLRQADGGTVFLDEVGEMSLRMQALFLRFLETGELQTLGSGAARERVNTRIITATNRSILDLVKRREFREDLYYRLNVFHLQIPALRQRPEDVPLLLDHFARLFANEYETVPPAFTQKAIDALARYSWPGNVRELRNTVERLVSRRLTPPIDAAHLPAELVVGATQPAADSSGQQRPSARVDALLHQLFVEKESFWTTAYTAFMMRDLTRDDLRAIVRRGLEQTQGSYRLLVDVFNMKTDDYKRFLAFLKQHDCHLPFQRFRALRAPADHSRRASAGRA
jgi:DNA-binding NtrC family response regulator